MLSPIYYNNFFSNTKNTKQAQRTQSGERERRRYIGTDKSVHYSIGLILFMFQVVSKLTTTSFEGTEWKSEISVTVLGGQRVCER
jgi:hypothetical protein